MASSIKSKRMPKYSIQAMRDFFTKRKQYAASTEYVDRLDAIIEVVCRSESLLPQGKSPLVDAVLCLHLDMEQQMLPVLPILVKYATQSQRDDALDATVDRGLALWMRALALEHGARFETEAIFDALSERGLDLMLEVLRIAELGGQGLEPTAVDSDGRTLLHHYCDLIHWNIDCDPRVEVAQRLVAWGVDPSARDRRRETALQVLMKPLMPGDMPYVSPLYAELVQETRELANYLASVTR